MTGEHYKDKLKCIYYKLFLFYSFINFALMHYFGFFNRFLECWNGVLTAQQCPFCDYYDVDKQQCNQVGVGVGVKLLTKMYAQSPKVHYSLRISKENISIQNLDLNFCSPQLWTVAPDQSRLQSKLVTLAPRWESAPVPGDTSLTPMIVTSMSTVREDISFIIQVVMNEFGL